VGGRSACEATSARAQVEPMAKVYFRHGVVGSAKTLNLLAVAHSYEIQGKKTLVVKPSMDTRFGQDNVKSRAGLNRQADLLVDAKTVFPPETFSGTDCVLVDEAQFVHPSVIEQLRHVASTQAVPVICYGLRTDFRSRLFPGSKRLMELADVIEEVKTTCSFCNRRATLNLKSVDGVPTLGGPTVCLGCEELYQPACYRHYVEKIQGGIEPIDFERAAREGACADAEQTTMEEKVAAENEGSTDDGVSNASHETPPTGPRGKREPESEGTPEQATDDNNSNASHEIPPTGVLVQGAPDVVGTASRQGAAEDEDSKDDSVSNASHETPPADARVKREPESEGTPEKSHRKDS